MPAPGKPAFSVRRLGVQDAGVYVDLRLEALRLHPEHFGATLEVEAAFTPERWTARLTEGVVFGGFLGPSLLGSAAYRRQENPKEAHVGWLGGMYVRAAARGTGLADQLVAAVLAHARTEVEHVILLVNAENVAAKWLYARHGFRPYGRHPQALKVDGRYHDEEFMLCRFADEPQS